MRKGRIEIAASEKWGVFSERGEVRVCAAPISFDPTWRVDGIKGVEAGRCCSLLIASSNE